MTEVTTTATPDVSLADILAFADWAILSDVATRVTAELPNLAPAVNVSADDVLADLERIEKNVAPVANYRKALAAVTKARATLETTAGVTLDTRERELSDARKMGRAKAIARLTTIADELATVTKIANFGNAAEKVQATLLHAKLTAVTKAAKGTVRQGKVSPVAEIRAALIAAGHDVGDRGPIDGELLILGRALVS